jgi:NAD(P)-dependent dehydrogenase (short-subunit alcohol dehydrogenase family)
MQGKQVLINGGTGALGSAVTHEALAFGALVTVPYVVEAEALNLQRSIDSDKLTVVGADMGDEQAVRAVIEGMPSIDVLIHLVGGFEMGPTHEVGLDAWRRHVDLNLTTTFLSCKHALGRMRASGYGRIVTVGSRAALEPMAECAAYCASKAGVVALTRVIAAETKGTDITANCVLPSVIDTKANRAAMGEQAAASWVKPSSLAQVICFLASERARDLRGAALPVYGNA